MDLSVNDQFFLTLIGTARFHVLADSTHSSQYQLNLFCCFWFWLVLSFICFIVSVCFVFLVTLGCYNNFNFSNIQVVLRFPTCEGPHDSTEATKIIKFEASFTIILLTQCLNSGEFDNHAKWKNTIPLSLSHALSFSTWQKQLFVQRFKLVLLH